ncbi:MAG TPA: RNA polymerase sigma factor SigM [Trebonia sp.]|nr:RNA polymerase sigma factor SigM [Trebonia sp.]
MSDLASAEPSDAVLLRQHAAGDPEAFGVLFKRHSARLWAVALRITCDPDDAADALQEAMISAFRRAGDFRGESAVTTWMHRIVVNASLDLLRRRSTRSVGWSGDPDDLPVPEPRPGTDSTAGAESRLDVDAALQTLPPPQRAALVLVDMLGYSVADASAILGVSEGTVKSRCARGRTKLLPHLSHLRGDYSRERNQTVTDGVSFEQGGGA